MFSSDFPHVEGKADPINLYGAPLRELDTARREQFLGGNIADAFEPMGDPLAV